MTVVFAQSSNGVHVHMDRAIRGLVNELQTARCNAHNARWAMRMRRRKRDWIYEGREHSKVWRSGLRCKLSRRTRSASRTSTVVMI